MLTEADSHLGPDQPPARAASRGASAWPSRSTGATASATASPAARCRRRRPTAPPPARASASATDDALRARLRRLARARGRSTRRRSTALRRRRLPRPARLRARATTRRCARGSVPGRRPATTCASYIDAVRRGAAGRRPVRRARGRLDLRGRRPRAPGDPRPLPARVRRPPDRQRALDGRGGRRRRRPRRRADAGAPGAARSTRCSATPRGWRRWAGRRRRWRGPTRLADRRRGARRGRRGERGRVGARGDRAERDAPRRRSAAWAGRASGRGDGLHQRL